MNTPAAPVASLFDMANNAFRAGMEKESLTLWYAHSIIDADAAAKLPETLQWHDQTKLTMAIRWGVGVRYTTSSKTREQGGRWKPYDGHPQPFGYTLPENNQPNAAKTLGAQSASAPGNPADRMLFYTGDFTEKAVNGILERGREGRWGEPVKMALEGNSEGFDYLRSGALGVMGGQGTPGGGPFKYTYTSTAKPSMTGMPQPQVIEHGIVAPGVYFVGAVTDAEKEKDLIERAAKEGLDFLMLFQMEGKADKGARTHTSGKVVVMHIPRAADGKEKDGEASKSEKKGKKSATKKPERLYSSKTIDNLKVDELRKAGKDDPVDSEVRALMAWIDENIVFKPLPESITAEKAKARCETLATTALASGNPLRSLLEIRYFHAKGMIDEDTMKGCLAQAFPGADEFLDADDEKKRELLTRWLPKLASLASVAMTGGNGMPGMPGMPGPGGMMPGPGGMMPPGGVMPGMPPGGAPPGGMPAPGGVLPPGAVMPMPPGGMPAPGVAPGGAMPPGAMPPGAMPPAAMPAPGAAAPGAPAPGAAPAAAGT